MVSSIHESEKPQLMLPHVVDMPKAPKRYMSRPYEDESMMSDSLEFNAVIENEFWYNKQPEVLNRASLPQKKEEPDFPNDTFDSPRIQDDGPKPMNMYDPNVNRVMSRQQVA